MKRCSDHHDHLIDLSTGSVIEFLNEDIEKLQRRVAEELGFDLVDHRLELYGVPKGQQEAGTAGGMTSWRPCAPPAIIAAFLIVTFLLHAGAVAAA